MNKHIVASPKQLCQNHCLIHHNVVRHECITCILIPQDFIYYSICVQYPIACFTLTNSYFSLHYCISLYSASSICYTCFFWFFFVSFHPVCFVLTRGLKLLTSTCPREFTFTMGFCILCIPRPSTPRIRVMPSWHH